MTQEQIKQIIRDNQVKTPTSWGELEYTDVEQAAAAIAEAIEKEKRVNGSLPAHACNDCPEWNNGCCLT